MPVDLLRSQQPKLLDILPPVVLSANDLDGGTSNHTNVGSVNAHQKNLDMTSASPSQPADSPRETLGPNSSFANPSGHVGLGRSPVGNLAIGLHGASEQLVCRHKVLRQKKPLHAVD